MRNFRVFATLFVLCAMNIMAAEREVNADVHELTLDSAGVAVLVLDHETEVLPDDGITVLEGSLLVEFRGQPGATVRYRSRRRAVRFPMGYWLDADGDGYGNIAVPRGAGTGTASGQWVENASDCNDADPKLIQSLTDLVPDCNLNGIPDDSLPTTACVGKGEDRTAIYHGPDGTLMGRAFVAYRDARGQVWISLSQSPRDSEGRILTDAAYGACPRL